MHKLTRATTAVLAFAITLTAPSFTRADDLTNIKAEITKRHDEAVKRLQDWIKLPSIAAENLNFPAGAELMAKLAKDGVSAGDGGADRWEAGRVCDARCGGGTRRL